MYNVFFVENVLNSKAHAHTFFVPVTPNLQGGHGVSSLNTVTFRPGLILNFACLPHELGLGNKGN